MKKVEQEDEWGDLVRELMDEGKEGDRWGWEERETEIRGTGVRNGNGEEGVGGRVVGFADGEISLSAAAWNGGAEASEPRR